MKKTIFLFSILTSLLQAQTTEEPKISETQKNYFSYISLGGCGLVIPVSPEIAIGWRKLNPKHAWEIQMGTSVILHKYYWGQASYLHYFIPPTGKYSAPYLGVGLTIGHLNDQELNYLRKYPVYGNIPITVGYQWGDKADHQFFQIQFTPLVITTLSYGVGF